MLQQQTSQQATYQIFVHDFYQTMQLGTELNNVRFYVLDEFL